MEPGGVIVISGSDATVPQIPPFPIGWPWFESADSAIATPKLPAVIKATCSATRIVAASYYTVAGQVTRFSRTGADA